MSANTDRTVPHSQPIPIHSRSRSHSVSDTSSSSEESSSPHSPVSPVNSPLAGMQPRIAPASPTTSSGVLNFFLGQSPKSPTNTFPFRRGFSTAVLDDDSEGDTTAPHSALHRRASVAGWPTTATTSAGVPPVTTHQQSRASGLLRRLSLGGAALNPPASSAQPTTRDGDRVPPNTPAVPRGPSPPTTTGRKTRRANTLAPGSQRPRRAPSPMGERILTGHFDGFN
ncbi:hypothetical protein BDY19DRAFT_688967 [Irpex rosettiformis]|uniref:Uncharacterized protein n=1 Tax=Irpex rosettiformis TaxID=378272 RepID=A0ACB8UA42_9APHY|nr:hypothetical protein BDY19DRAFT_688967 [Irpex rosettiformis]